MGAHKKVPKTALQQLWFTNQLRHMLTYLGDDAAPKEAALGVDQARHLGSIGPVPVGVDGHLVQAAQAVQEGPQPRAQLGPHGHVRQAVQLPGLLLQTP